MGGQHFSNVINTEVAVALCLFKIVKFVVSKPHCTCCTKMSKDDSDEEFEDPMDETLKKVGSHVEEVYSMLKGEMARIHQEKDALDAAAQKLKHVHFSKMLKLNVGGHFFTTSLETMKKDPGSMLHAMFSERFDTKASEDGSYFIDRDGTHFRFILNYLRIGQLLLPEDKSICKELLAEAEFYQIRGIIDELKARPFQESLILSPEHRQTLITWLMDTLTSGNNDYTLLYRASRNGWASANFHTCCDYKGPTVTVIKSGNNIFGGYTEQQWEAHPSGVYKTASKSFLFSLVNATGLKPTMLPLMPEQEGNAVFCHSSYGPTFGKGNDLRIGNSPNSGNCLTNLNNSYQCPTGQNTATFLTGNQNFAIQEMEVFGYQK